MKLEEAQPAHTSPQIEPEREKLIIENLPVVQKMAGRLVMGGLGNFHEYEEVVSDGYVGLVEGARRVKMADGEPTNRSYLIRYIKGWMLLGMRERYGRSYEAEGSSPEGIVKKQDNIRRVKPSVMKGRSTVASLDKPLEEGEGEKLGDIVADPKSEDSVIHNLLIKEELRSLLANCTQRDKDIFFRHVIMGYPQAEIARAYGISQMQVSRIVGRIKAGDPL